MIIISQCNQWKDKNRSFNTKDNSRNEKKLVGWYWIENLSFFFYPKSLNISKGNIRNNSVFHQLILKQKSATRNLVQLVKRMKLLLFFLFPVMILFSLSLFLFFFIVSLIRDLSYGCSLHNEVCSCVKKAGHKQIRLMRINSLDNELCEA